MPDQDEIRIENPIEFIQATRTGWITKLNAKQLVEILPPRPVEQLTLLTDTNRPISPPHIRGIVTFLNSTPNWALPGIILAVNPDTVQKDQDASLTIPQGQLRVLDGQHRINALSEYIQEAKVAVEQGKAEPSRLHEIQESEFPVAIFQVANTGDQQQMFAWFARSKPIEAATREWFDRSDPFNNAAKHAIQESTTLGDRVDTLRGRTSKPNEDRTLMTLIELKGIATTIAIGIGKNPKKTDKETYLTEDKQDELQANLIRFFDEFLPTAGDIYELLQEENRSQDQIHFKRRETYHLFPQTIRLFADCWARMEIDMNLSTEGLRDVISQMNLNKANPENYLERDLQVIKPGTETFLRLNNPAWRQATAAINQRARG